MKDMKFRATCECGAKSPRLATHGTVEKWMRTHRTQHLAPHCDHRFKYGRCYGCGSKEGETL